MTKRILSLVAVAALLAVVTPLSVTTSAAEINCRIPFSFVVNGKTLPPGSYSISTSGDVVMLRGLRVGAIALTNRASSLDRTAAKAVFLKTGDRYDLAEIWTGDGAGRQLTVPKHLADRRASNMPVERIVVTADGQNR